MEVREEVEWPTGGRMLLLRGLIIGSVRILPLKDRNKPSIKNEIRLLFMNLYFCFSKFDPAEPKEGLLPAIAD